jgi:hypothetical protein
MSYFMPFTPSSSLTRAATAATGKEDSEQKTSIHPSAQLAVIQLASDQKRRKMALTSNGSRARILAVPNSERKSKAIAKDQTFANLSLMPSIGYHPHNDLVYKFTRLRRVDGFLTSSTSLDVTGALTFTLGEVAGYSEFTALFDIYRIVMIEHWIIPRFSINTDRSYNPGLLASAVDYDGGSTNYDGLTQYQNAMISSGLEGHFCAFKPGVLYDVQSSNAAFVTSPWLDVAEYGLIHHGINYAVTPTSLAQTWDRVVRFHFEFKRVR